MAEIYAFPTNGNNPDTFARADAAEPAGADNPPIFTAIPRVTVWALSALPSSHEPAGPRQLARRRLSFTDGGMSNVIALPTKPRVENYFGGCPECGGTNGFVNVGANHWFVCDEHRTKWCCGTNLFSHWREEDEAEWLRNANLLSGYREVMPLLPDDEYGGGA